MTGSAAAEKRLRDLAWLRRARDRIDREYASPLDLRALARGAAMSEAHFSRQFRAAYGETPYAYLMTRRIERAKALLRRGDISVTEVCLAVGCTSLGSFSARFTELVGETPTAYRNRDHGALAGVPGCIARDLTRPGRDHGRRLLPARRRGRPHQLPERQPRRRRGGRRAGRQGGAERGPLPQRRPRRELREGAGLGRRDRLGARRAAVGHAGLRRPRPVRQPGAHRPAARRYGLSSRRGGA